MRTVVLGLALASLMTSQPPAKDFDPVGKWTYSTRDDTGAPVSGTMEIAGTPGNYAGTILTNPDRRIPITEVMTSPTGMIVLATIDNGGVAVIKVWRSPDGKLQAAGALCAR